MSDSHPTPGYTAVREAAGFAERADLAVIRMWGKDPVKMLQGLITADLAGTPADRATFGAMLTPKGRTITELRVARLPGDAPELLLVLPRAALEGTRAHLGKFVPPMFARWADATEGWAVAGVYGPRAAETLRAALGVEVDGAGEDAVGTGTLGDDRLLALRTLDAGREDGYDLLLPRAALAPALDALRAAGAESVDAAALEALRVEAGRPRWGSDLDEETIPTEAWQSTGLLERGISFGKGCYTGQEVIVRIAHRGHVNRHLRGLRLGETPPPAHDAPLLHPETGKTIGRVTTAVQSPRFGETIALAYVRREIGPGGQVRLGDGDGVLAEVVELPFDHR